MGFDGNNYARCSYTIIIIILLILVIKDFINTFVSTKHTCIAESACVVRTIFPGVSGFSALLAVIDYLKQLHAL